MALAKIITKESSFRKFKLTNFLYVLKENQLICSKCFKSIENNEYCYLCRDFDKIWHENCFDDNHIKRTFETISNVKAHGDMFCLIKYLSQEVFDAFETEPIDLNI